MKNQESTSNENKWLDNITLYKTARYDEIEEALEYLTSLFKDFDVKIFKTKEDSNGHMSIAVSGTDSELDALTDMYIENFNDIKDSCDLDAMGWTDPDDIEYYTEKGSAELRKSLYGESKKNENGKTPKDEVLNIMGTISRDDKVGQYINMESVKEKLDDLTELFEAQFGFEPGRGVFVCDIHEDSNGNSDDDDEAEKWNACAQITDGIMDMFDIPQGKMLNAQVGENWEALQWDLYDGGIEDNYIPEGSNESKQTKKNEDTLADMVIQVRKPGQQWSLYTVTWPEYVDMYKKEATEERGWPEVRVLKRGFNGRMDVIDGPDESKKSEANDDSVVPYGIMQYHDFETDAWIPVLVGINTNSRGWFYEGLAPTDNLGGFGHEEFSREFLKSCRVGTDKCDPELVKAMEDYYLDEMKSYNNKKVNDLTAYIPKDMRYVGKDESNKSEANDDNWVAYYFCKDPQGLEWAVLPHTANQIGNANCLSERGGMDTIGMEYVLSKCTPIENLKDSKIYKAALNGEDRRIVPLKKEDAERIFKSKNGLEELKAIVVGMAGESKKSEDTSVIHVNGENGDVDIYTINIVAINSDGSEDYLYDMATAKTYYDEDEAIKDAQELADSYKDDDRVVQVFVTAGEYEKPNGDIGGEPFDIFTASSSDKATTAKYRTLAGYAGNANIDYYSK